MINSGTKAFLDLSRELASNQILPGTMAEIYQSFWEVLSGPSAVQQWQPLDRDGKIYSVVPEPLTEDSKTRYYVAALQAKIAGLDSSLPSTDCSYTVPITPSRQIPSQGGLVESELSSGDVALPKRASPGSSAPIELSEQEVGASEQAVRAEKKKRAGEMLKIEPGRAVGPFVQIGGSNTPSVEAVRSRMLAVPREHVPGPGNTVAKYQRFLVCRDDNDGGQEFLCPFCPGDMWFDWPQSHFKEHGLATVKQVAAVMGLKSYRAKGKNEVLVYE